MVGIKREPIRFILFEPESMVKTPRADAVIKIKKPRRFVKYRLTARRIRITAIDKNL
jgi:hypothetical protein